MDISDTLPEPLWKAAARQNPRLSDAVDALPPVETWVELGRSLAWFSPFHFTGNEAFEFPFYPQDYVYSPVVEVGIDPAAHGYYKRGVRKYRTLIRKGKVLPPITCVWTVSRIGHGLWALEDGGHRSSAAVREGLSTQPAVLAFPKALLR